MNFSLQWAPDVHNVLKGYSRKKGCFTLWCVVVCVCVLRVCCFSLLTQVIQRCRCVETSSGDLSQLHTQNPSRTVRLCKLGFCDHLLKPSHSAHAQLQSLRVQQCPSSFVYQPWLDGTLGGYFYLTGYGRPALAHSAQWISLPCGGCSQHIFSNEV